MAVKYTEEQLNTVDKSFLIHLLLQRKRKMSRYLLFCVYVKSSLSI